MDSDSNKNRVVGTDIKKSTRMLNNIIIRGVKKLTGLGFIFGALYLALYLYVYHTDTGPSTLDSNSWKNDQSGCSFYGNNTRTRMADAVIAWVEETSPNKDSVDKMLGPPIMEQSEHLWRYHAGTSSIDCLSLHITFANGEKTKASLQQH